MQKIKKAQNFFSVMVVFSECSHVFCCVLPTMFSVISVFVGMGLIGAVPVWMSELHESMHSWELPIICASGLVLASGWIAHHLSRRMDCHDTGCVHGSCEPKKKHNQSILKIATALFVINIFVYFVFHHGMEMFIHGAHG